MRIWMLFLACVALVVSACGGGGDDQPISGQPTFRNHRHRPLAQFTSKTHQLTRGQLERFQPYRLGDLLSVSFQSKIIEGCTLQK